MPAYVVPGSVIKIAVGLIRIYIIGLLKKKERKTWHMMQNYISADKVYLSMWFLYSYKTTSSRQTHHASLVY